jgi:hypothetical protein
MDIGMLWYDDDSRRTLNDKVARAVEHYRTKYGAQPTVCFVNPTLLKEKDAPDLAAGLLLRASRQVMLNHFWIGVGEGEGVEAKAKKRISRN